MTSSLDSVQLFLNKHKELLKEPKKSSQLDPLTLEERLTEGFTPASRKRARMSEPEETFDFLQFDKIMRSKMLSKLDYDELAVMDATCKIIHNQLIPPAVPNVNKLNIYEVTMTVEMEFFIMMNRAYTRVPLIDVLSKKPSTVHLEAEKMRIELSRNNIEFLDNFVAMLSDITAKNLYVETFSLSPERIDKIVEVLAKVGAKSLEMYGCSVNESFFLRPEVIKLERFETHQFIDLQACHFKRIPIPTIIVSLPKQTNFSFFLSLILEKWRCGAQIKFYAFRDIQHIWDVKKVLKEEQMFKFNRTMKSLLRFYCGDFDECYVVKRGKEEESSDFLFVLWRAWEIRFGTLEGIVENRNCSRKL